MCARVVYVQHGRIEVPHTSEATLQLHSGPVSTLPGASAALHALLHEAHMLMP